MVSQADTKAKDILLDKGSINTENGDNLLTINFKRMTARFEVNVDARGMFGQIDASSTMQKLTSTAGRNILKSGDFNIFTEIYSNIQEYDISKTVTPTVGSNSRICWGALGTDKPCFNS